MIQNNTIQKWLKRSKGFLLNICMAFILIGVCYVILSPIFGIISNSVKDLQDVFNPLIFLIPQNFTLDNLRYAWQHMDYVSTLAATMGFSIGMAAIHVLITSMVGYGFARFKFPGSNLLFGLMIITIVVPVQTYMVPLFMQFRFFGIFGLEANLIDSYLSIALLTITGVGLRSGLYIYIFRQFFKGLPKEIEEAAFIDGASTFRTYATVMVPNAMSAIITVFLFAFVWHYNDTFYTSLLVTNNRLMAVMLTTVGTQFSIMESVRDHSAIQLVVFAGIVLAIIPILTIYMFLQRHFVEGMERSGIVG
ncbi:MAG: carbohydrate ABC transporter permease [Defluviitaleaceae bacterium]|nr:carbohydrate ABC transporter permease [Defluviitaleaceae bacterium]